MNPLSKVYSFIFSTIMIPIMFIFGTFFAGLDVTATPLPSELFAPLSGLDNKLMLPTILSYIAFGLCGVFVIAAVMFAVSIYHDRDMTDSALGLKVDDPRSQLD